MSRLLTTYANMLEASVRTPEWFPGRRPSPVELERRLRVVALLRSLTPDEAAALVRGQQYPVRLGALADEVGLSVEECGRELAAIVWKLTEGLRPLPDPNRKKAEPGAALDCGGV